MTRSHARILCSIWNDDDYLALDIGPQWLYKLICSQGNLNHAGVIGLTVRRWAGLAKNATVSDIKTYMSQLAAGRFIVVDETTEELLVRSLIRRDGIAEQPNILKAALNDAQQVASPVLRAVLAAELRRLPAKREDTARMRYPDPHAVADLIDPGPSATPPPGKPSGKAFPNPSGKASPMGSDLLADDPFGLFPQTLPETLPGSLVERSRGRGRGRGSTSSLVLENSTSSKNTPPLASLAASDDATAGTPAGPVDDEPAADEPDHFAEFYDAYPRRKDRRAAEKAWRAATKRGVQPEELIAAARRYADQTRNTEARYVKYPASWLNAGAYADGPDAPRLAVVRSGYQPFANPTDASVYDEPLLEARPMEPR